MTAAIGGNGWWLARHAREVLSCRHAPRVQQSYLHREVDDVTAHRVAADLEKCPLRGLEAGTYAAIKQALARRAPGPPMRSSDCTASPSTCFRCRMPSVTDAGAHRARLCLHRAEDGLDLAMVSLRGAELTAQAR